MKKILTLLSLLLLFACFSTNKLTAQKSPNILEVYWDGFPIFTYKLSIIGTTDSFQVHIKDKYFFKNPNLKDSLYSLVFQVKGKNIRINKVPIDFLSGKTHTTLHISSNSEDTCIYKIFMPTCEILLPTNQKDSSCTNVCFRTFHDKGMNNFSDFYSSWKQQKNKEKD